jgi:hypothetical protein
MRVYVTIFIVAFTSISHQTLSYLTDHFLLRFQHKYIYICHYSSISTCLIPTVVLICHNHHHRRRRCRRRRRLHCSMSQFYFLSISDKCSPMTLRRSQSRCTFDKSSMRTLDNDTTFLVMNSMKKLHEMNFNQNANDIDDESDRAMACSYYIKQSSPDLLTSTDNLSSSVYREQNSHKHAPIRIESALVTSDYSQHRVTNSIEQTSRSIMNLNMNRTMDVINRIGAGDENLSSAFHDKQVQTVNRADTNEYLPLERVTIQNRHEHPFTSKRFLLISMSTIVFIVLLCLIAILLHI